MNIEQLLLLDIETVPQQPEFSLLDDCWQKLWIEKSSRYPFAANCTPEEAYTQRAGILAEFGKMICFSTGYFYSDKNKKLCLQLNTCCGHDEKKLLNAFLDTTETFSRQKKIFEFAGHNIKEFDIPFLCRRLTIHNLALPSYLQLNSQKPWETNIFDTLNWWKFGDHKNYISLKLLSAVLGLPSAKEEMDGSQVKDVYYQEQNFAKIAEYCSGDVAAVAQVLLRFRNNPQLSINRVSTQFNII
jgi:3'-5' exonuclease